MSHSPLDEGQAGAGRAGEHRPDRETGSGGRTRPDIEQSAWPTDTDALASLLARTEALVLAVLDEEGGLVEGNRGFRRLVDAEDAAPGEDMAPYLANPTFATLQEAAAAHGRDGLSWTWPIHRGLVSLGSRAQDAVTVRGEVFLRQGRYVIVAEHDIEDLRALTTQMFILTEDMADMQRELVLARKEVERREADLAKLASTDPLTGLLNRRAFDRRLGEEIERSLRTSVPMSVVMVDLDRFKEFNDTWGHLCGDRCLERVAVVLQTHSRPYDAASRYGGEEFVLVLPGADATAARHRAETLRTAIAETDIPGADARVTASFGVAQYGGSSAEDVLRAADEALYEAKDGGRDRVVVAGEARDE